MKLEKIIGKILVGFSALAAASCGTPDFDGLDGSIMIGNAFHKTADSGTQDNPNNDYDAGSYDAGESDSGSQNQPALKFSGEKVLLGVEDTEKIIDLNSFFEYADSYNFDVETPIMLELMDSHTAKLTQPENWNSAKEGAKKVKFQPCNQYFGCTDFTEFDYYVEGVNDAPAISAIPPIQLMINSTKEVDISQYASDIDGDELTLSLGNNSYPNIQLELYGKILKVTSNDKESSAISSISVSDGKESATTMLQVSSKKCFNPDKMPLLSENIEQIVFDEDTTYKKDLNQIYCSDLPMTFEVFDQTPNVSITLEGSILNIKPAANYNGEGNFTMLVCNQVACRKDPFSYIINKVNDAPVFGEMPEVKLEAGKSDTVDFSKAVSDPDGDNITLSVSGSNNFTSVVNGYNITFTATGKVTTETPSLIASDGTKSVTKPFKVQILKCYNKEGLPEKLKELDAPVFNEDTTFTHQLLDTFCAENQAELTHKVTISSNKVAASIANYQILQLVPAKDWFGTFTVGVEACNPKGCVSSTANGEVKNVNDPPVFGNISTYSFSIYDVLVLDMTPYITDADNDPITLTATASNFDITIDKLVATLKPKVAGSEYVNFAASDGKVTANRSVYITVNDPYGCINDRVDFAIQPDGSYHGTVHGRFYANPTGLKFKTGDTIVSTASGTVCWQGSTCSDANGSSTCWGLYAAFVKNGNYTSVVPKKVGASWTEKLTFADSDEYELVYIIPDGSSYTTCTSNLYKDNGKQFDISVKKQ